MHALVSGMGAREISDHDAGNPLPQRVGHHRLGPATPTEVPRLGRAEGPDVAVPSILTPVALVDMEHQAAADAVLKLRCPPVPPREAPYRPALAHDAGRAARARASAGAGQTAAAPPHATPRSD